MKKHISKLKNNPALVGTLAMLIGSNIYNGGQFVFHILAGRYLGKATYADLAAIISIFGIISIVQAAVSLSIVRSIASYSSTEKIGAFSRWISKWSIIFATIALAVCFATSSWLVGFLHLYSPILGYLLGLLLFFYIIVTTWRSILQGLTKFELFSLSLSIESLSKLVIFAIAIVLGFALMGAIASMVLSLLIAAVSTFWSVRKYLHAGKEIAPELTGFFRYSFMALLQGLALTMMYSTDLLLVKHYFSADQAGIYTSLSILGRIIFFGITPISQMMFPMVVKKASEGKEYLNLFYLCLAVVLVMILILMSAYYLIPSFIIGLLYGSAYVSGSEMLWWFALSLGLLGLSNVFVQFYLSLGKTKIVSWFIAAAIVQILLIVTFHSSLLQVVQVTAASDALLLVGLLLYFPYHHGFSSSKS